MCRKRFSEITTVISTQTVIRVTTSLIKSLIAIALLMFAASSTKRLLWTAEDSIAKTARDFCDKLFAIESELDKLTTEERFKKRLTQEKPVFEAFWSWAEKVAPTVLPKTQLGKAFEYAFKRREYLGNYFKTATVLFQTTQRKMRSVRSQSAERTGCSVILRTEQKPALIYTASLRQQKRTGLMFSNTLNCC